MIIGTAGHIDHGKTALVKALTGTDADRLPEEKRRGITIELGYAFLDGQEGRIAFVDVPGHERLLRTMVAGASGIDYALLVVSADDGPMPQTREHVAVLSLLGVSRGCVAITKTDRVGEAAVQDVITQVRSLLAGTPLAGASCFPVSSTTLAGIEPLRLELMRAATALKLESADPALGFRLPLDRAFTVKGAGTVVTGSPAAGVMRVGDELAIAPRGMRVRARGVHVQNRTSEWACTGQRTAVQLAGADADLLGRGVWLCHPAVALATDRIDARVTVWRDEPAPLRSGTTVHLHHGTADVLASIALLDDVREIPPGAAALVQLVLRAPIAAWRGDRLLLRDARAERTIAGGVVLDPRPPRRYRRTPARLAELSAHALGTPDARLHALVQVAPYGVDLRAWSLAEGRIVDPPPLNNDVVAVPGYAIAQERLASLALRLRDIVANFHMASPDQAGVDTALARRMVAPLLPEAGWLLVLQTAVAAGSVVRRGPVLATPEHGVRLSAQDDGIRARVLPLILQSELEPPWLRELAAFTGEEETALRAALIRLARRGEFHQVVPDLFFAHATIVRLAFIVRTLAAANGMVRPADFRDASGLRRKRAVQVLEYFDRTGLLRRVRDVHHVRTDSALFTAG